MNLISGMSICMKALKNRLLLSIRCFVAEIFTDPFDYKAALFIVGPTCSGTTLLEKMLASSKRVDGLPTEGQWLTNQLMNAKKQGYQHLYAASEEVIAMQNKEGIRFDKIKSHWMYFRNTKGGDFFIEKTPSNLLRVNSIEEKFHNAYFVGLFRDPCATIGSIVKRRKQTYGVDTDIEIAIQHVRNCYTILLRENRCRDNFRVLSYESLVKNPESIVSSIYEQLDSHFDWVGINKHELFTIKGEARPILNNCNSGTIDLLPVEWQMKIRSELGALYDELSELSKIKL